MLNFAESRLSIITPVYRNAATVEELAKQALGVAAPLFREVEHIFVVDGSPDDSYLKLERMARNESRIRVINLTRNFGQHTALMAGMRHCKGDFVFFLDGDLEEDPATLPLFMAKLQEGYDLAVGQRDGPRRGFFKSITANLFTLVYNFFADYHIVGNTTNMRLMKRKFVMQLLHFTEPPFIGGFTAWIGRPIGFVPVQWIDQQRQSSYSFIRLLRHARFGIIGFSTKILRVSTLAGVALSCLSLVYAAYAVLSYFILGDVLRGFTTIVVLLSFFFGIQFIFIGLLGEYITEVFKSVKARPLYLVQDFVNFDHSQTRESQCVELPVT